MVAKPAFIVCLGAVLFLIATNVGAGWLYVVVAAMGAVMIVSAPLAWWSVRGVEVTRRAPVIATAGEPFECSLEVKNTGRLPRYLLEVEDRFAGDKGRAVAVRVRRDRPEVLRYTVENPRRGIYRGGELIVESRGPFGLFYGRRQRWATSETVVYPRTFEVAGLPPAAVVVDAERGDGSEASTLHRGHGGEFWGIREYRPGDPARLVAWKRSARSLLSGKLAVVELARETHPPLVIAMSLDAGAPRGAREMVISAGASLLLYGLGEGREVKADAGPDNPPFPEEPNPDNVLTWCASLLVSSPPDPEGASVEVRPTTRRQRAAGGKRTSLLPNAPVASAARAVVLVSCHELAGSGPWMSPEEERDLIERTESEGRLVARLGADVAEPWRIE